ncbi:trithorax group protein osa-like [Homarus americanus]|uniref:trithorax group protein osa-like n=1 Tax=Homarus americanus TaxID=6706 RepID=UPI001C477542|nr:trithorax group protein osa-like [Homarus americanus]
MEGVEGTKAGGGRPHDDKNGEDDPVGDADLRDSPASQHSFSSLPSLQDSSGSQEGEAAHPTISTSTSWEHKTKPRVEGRRGRNWWDWKAAEQRKMQSGDEGDDELTSLESESLKRRTPLPKIRENLPEPDGGRDGGYGIGGTGGGGVLGGVGAGMGGARGPSGGGGGSPGLRVTWDERAAEPPLLHQPRHQPLLLQQHHFLPQQQQQQQQQLPHTRRAAPGPPGNQSGLGSGAPRYTTSHAPPTPAQPNDQPKKVTITSFNQPKLTSVVPPLSGPPTPSPEKKEPPPPEKKPSSSSHTKPLTTQKTPTPAYDSKSPATPGKALPTYPEKGAPLSPESPPPSAPPKDLVYADARERKGLSGQPHKYSSRKQEEPPKKAPPQDLAKKTVQEVPATTKCQPSVHSSPTRAKESKDKVRDRGQGGAREKSGELVKDKPKGGGGGVSEKERQQPSSASDSQTVAVWKPQPGGGAKYGPPPPGDKKRVEDQRSGSLVWVNLPGGGSKLEWMPTPALVTIKSTPALPSRDVDRSYQLVHKHNDSAAGAAPGTDARGRGERGGGGAQPASGERVTRAISAVPRASVVGVNPGVHGSPRSAGGGTPVQGVLKQPSASPSNRSAQSKNGVTSAPGATHRPEGRGTNDDESTVLTVAGRSSGQVVRIRVRPEVHAYLTGLPTTYIAANIHAATASGRRDSHQDSQSSSGSALTAGSEGGGEGSTGYHEHDYEEVVDEYTLLRRAVDDHDPEAMQLLAVAEAAINPDIPARPHDPGQSCPLGDPLRAALCSISANPPTTALCYPSRPFPSCSTNAGSSTLLCLLMLIE